MLYYCIGTVYTVVSKAWSLPLQSSHYNPVFPAALAHSLPSDAEENATGGFHHLWMEGLSACWCRLPVEDSQVDGVDLVLEALESPESFSSRF